MSMAKLHDFEATRVAAYALCRRETVRAFLKPPERMKAATRARVEAALSALGYVDDGVPTPEGSAALRTLGHEGEELPALPPTLSCSRKL